MVRLSDIKECRTCKQAIYLGNEYAMYAIMSYGRDYSPPAKVWVHVETHVSQCAIKAEPF